MATTVNARDVILQAYSPRVATVSMSPNLVVSQDQVQGLGLVVAGTKMVFLSATTQVFQIAKSGTVSPASTVLTADLKNLTATPTLSVISGTITPAPTLVGGTVTIPYANMTTDTALIRLTVVQDAVTYTDEITLVKVREGIDGLMGFVTNEAHTVAADYLGNVLAYTNAGGSFKVFQGVNDITSLCSFSIPAGGNADALTATINASTGVYSVTGGYPTNKDLVTLLLRATFGSVTLDKVFTLSKSKAGAPGTNGTSGTSGTNGIRGSRTFYVTLTGTTAVFSDTLATTTASADGGPVLNDVVTQYNTSQGFSQTKFYTASGWVVVNAIVDGNLIVSGTIGATQMQTNLLNADNVLTRGLTVRDTSGNIILSSGVPLPFSRVAGTTNGKITAGNATTFIDNAAINSAQVGTLTFGKLTDDLGTFLVENGRVKADYLRVNNASIDGAIFSTNWVYGVSGWYLDRTGALYANSGEFRGALVGATGTFSGALSAASGTFSGSLTANAVNAVSTINIAGNSVTVSNSAAGQGGTYSTNISVPSGQTMTVVGTGYLKSIASSSQGAVINATFSMTGAASTSVASGALNVDGNPVPGVTALLHSTVTGPATVTLTVTANYDTVISLFGRMR
jgi:hypothetical protein